MKMPVLPAINVRHPYGRMIISGEKAIESRTYCVPAQYLNRDLYLVETGRPSSTAKTAVLGVIRFTDCFEYKSLVAFRNDESQHLVEPGSVWDWTDKPKWGWKVQISKTFDKPAKPSGPRGIRFTKTLRIAF